MKRKEIIFSMEEFDSSDELPEQDRNLLSIAREVTSGAYAPYSHFHVGAAALLDNGEVISATNQENASFPVGLCAERVLLAAASSRFPNVPINSIAISYHNLNDNSSSNNPVAPCGVCRQTLQELEDRMKKPIRLILSGMEGKALVIPTASTLLPLAFSQNELLG